MLLALLVLLFCVMLAGILFATLGMRGRKLPLIISSLHGIAGVTLIVLLVMHDLHFPHNTLVNAATVLLVLTATGGLLLFGFRAGRQPLPGLIVGLHAGFAAVALALMIVGYVRT
ncbi:MAG TPA: hypothetical protein VNF48_06645 [Gammaproteobacteria bacterium]|nr:hypothetical protein [Gammaproteobacteria bacterium]